MCYNLGFDIDALADDYIKIKNVSDIPMTVLEINYIKNTISYPTMYKESINVLVNRLTDKPLEFVQLMPLIIVLYYGHIASAGTGQFFFDAISPEMIEVKTA